MGYDDDIYGSSNYGADSDQSGGYESGNDASYGAATTPPAQGQNIADQPAAGSYGGGYGEAGYGAQGYSPEPMGPASRPQGGGGKGLLVFFGAVVMVALVCGVALIAKNGQKPSRQAAATTPAATPVAQPEPGAQRYIAVAIGCSDYRSKPAPGCAEDAKKTALAFKNLGYETHLMNDSCTDVDGRQDEGLCPTKKNIEQHMNQWLPAGSLGPEDTVVFFFSGRGVGAAADYLTPLKTKWKLFGSDDLSELVSVKWVAECLLGTKAGRILLITDSGHGEQANGEAGEDSFGAATHQAITDGQLQGTGGIEVKLVYLRSCQKGQRSYGTESGSFFTAALCESLEGKDGGVVTTGSVYDYVRAQVMHKAEEQGGKQEPVWSLHGEETTEMTLKPDPLRPMFVTGDLADAVKTAKPGATLKLRGTFKLTAPLVINKPITLQGDTSVSSKVVGSCAGCLVRFEGAGPWTVRGSNFEHTGKSAGEVVFVGGGKFEAHACSFCGARSEQTKEGLNHGVGLAIGGECSSKVTDCECTDNEYAGLYYGERASGVAARNKCSGNGCHGIQVVEQAKPELDLNQCVANGQVGIVIFSTSGGDVQGNICVKNQLDGIAIVGQARPNLVGNGCGENRRYGIFYSGNATGTAVKNECADNRASGIAVIEHAQPSFDGNSSHENEQSGVFFAGAASGSFVNGVCTKNKLDGISVEGNAQPTLKSNACVENKRYGMRFAGSAGGSARDNNCRGNGSEQVHRENGTHVDLGDAAPSGGK